MATTNGQFDLALMLIKKGANPNLTSDAGASPLFAVLERQWAPWANYAHPVDYQQQKATHLDVLQTLLDAGADLLQIYTGLIYEGPGLLTKLITTGEGQAG